MEIKGVMALLGNNRKITSLYKLVTYLILLDAFDMKLKFLEFSFC